MSDGNCKDALSLFNSVDIVVAYNLLIAFNKYHIQKSNIEEINRQFLAGIHGVKYKPNLIDFNDEIDSGDISDQQRIQDMRSINQYFKRI